MRTSLTRGRPGVLVASIASHAAIPVPVTVVSMRTFKAIPALPGAKRHRVCLHSTALGLFPAPAASWDPSTRKSGSLPVAPDAGGSIRLTVNLPEDAVLQTTAHSGTTLLEALEAADLGDVWQGGACGGACACSTCRVVVVHSPSPLAERGEDELDMLDAAAVAASRLLDQTDGMTPPQREAASEALATEFLAETSRLACQLNLAAEHDQLIVALPDDVTNMLEVPLWLRGGR